MTEALLQVRDLRAKVAHPNGASTDLLRGISFDVDRAERVALVGESGSGKSVTGRAIMRLDDAIELSGSIRFGGRDVLALSAKEMAAVRGSEISMVFQDPLSALNPLERIGDQVAEPLRIRGVRRKEAQRRAQRVLDELGIANAARRMRAYPHEFSGGMRQRVVLAMALVNNPSLLIADEPTTALDVRVQAQVLELLETTTRERGLATLFVTHDLGVVSSFADRVLVMYSGSIVESTTTRRLLSAPSHPYTVGLIGASPRMSGPVERLVALPGTAPHPGDRPRGCAFAPRCPLHIAICAAEDPLPAPIEVGHDVACHVVARDRALGR